jgi:hypothetical protein
MIPPPVLQVACPILVFFKLRPYFSNRSLRALPGDVSRLCFDYCIAPK